ncbi:MAG TPA: hypothetical protein VH643_21140 [Gemmataceae bacterium]|jgi:DNA-binding MarR family transcriptional regulator
MDPPSSNPFSRESLTLKPGDSVQSVKIQAQRARTGTERRFLPALPEKLFKRLVVLPGKSWAIYLVLLQRSRMERSNPVVLTSACLRQHGLNRTDKYRALPALETAGLIRVERRDRRNPLVWLLEEARK